jgi:glutamate synthase (NADPH/NADH) small chain
MLLKTTTSHEEGSERHWSVETKRFIGEKGRVKGLECVKVKSDRSHLKMNEVRGSKFKIDVDLVILAVGFIGPEDNGLLRDLDVGLDSRGNVKTNEKYMTSAKNVFSAGDMRRGQSLVVWAISEGRRAAYFIDEYLMGESNLPKI